MQIEAFNPVASQLVSPQNGGQSFNPVQSADERTKSANANAVNTTQDTVELSAAASTRPVTEPGNAAEEQSEKRPDGDDQTPAGRKASFSVIA